MMYGIVAEDCHERMMKTLEGCHVRIARKTNRGNHPERAKKVVCAGLGAGEYGFREYRMCRRKDRYRSQGDAADKINRIHVCRSEAKLKTYFCPYCEGWHLTHMREESA